MSSTVSTSTASAPSPTRSDLPSENVFHEESDYVDQFQPDFQFNDAVIHSSAEGALFRVPSITLRMASGFFRTMLPLPQGQEEEEEIIQLEEPTRVVGTMLRIVCCVGIDVGCALATIDDMSALLFAAEKYDIPGVIFLVQASITSRRFLRRTLLIYSISCRHGWTEESRLAARYTLALDFKDKKHRQALDSLSGASLMALINHRWQRKSVLKNMLDADTFNANLPEVPCRQSSCGAWLEFGSAWREFKWAILEEIDRIPSGDSITKGDFMQSAPAVALFQNKCHSCQVACFSKEDTVKAICAAINGLPKSI